MRLLSTSDHHQFIIKYFSETLFLMFNASFLIIKVRISSRHPPYMLPVLSICVKSGKRTHGVTNGLEAMSCKSKPMNSFALNKCVLLLRGEVVITPIRRGGEILSIRLPVDSLSMHPSALLLTRKRLTNIPGLSTWTISTPRPRSSPSRMALVFLQLRWMLY